MRRKGIISVLVLVVFALVMAFKPSDKFFEIHKSLDIFATLFEEVNKFYVDDVSPNEMMTTGIHAMLETLDPYTNYISEDQIEDFRTMSTGVYGGIGALVGTRDGRMIILMPYTGYAAEKAGLQIGDEILQIDGVKVEESKEVDDVSKLLKGQANTTINLVVKRFGTETLLNFSLTRENIQLKNVPYFGMVTDDIGLIQLTDFTSEASNEVKNALVDLKQAGAKKIILDLRGNPGGLLNEAIRISNLFLPKGSEIVRTRGRIEEWNQIHRATSAPVDLEIPLAVLVDHNSASAAEIVSGVIQDYDRGVIIGQRSFGKGLVQATRSLSYNSKLKVTVAKYYIPSGRCIQEIDYSHRNELGSPGKIPDSLKVAFKTQNGRTVYDGGGITPDIDLPEQELAHITQSLIQQGLIFDYATIYRFKNLTIAPAKSYLMNEKEYADFLTWLKTKNYAYQTDADRNLETLIASSKSENYYESLKPQIDALTSKLAASKEQDAIKYKSEIMEILETEIITRYYFQPGQVESTFDDDQEIKSAVSILNNPQQYSALLSGKK